MVSGHITQPIRQQVFWLLDSTLNRLTGRLTAKTCFQLQLGHQLPVSLRTPLLLLGPVCPISLHANEDSYLPSEYRGVPRTHMELFLK